MVLRSGRPQLRPCATAGHGFLGELVDQREIDAVVGELLTNGVAAEDLQRMQNRNLADFLRGTERLGGFGGRSDILANSMTYGGSPDFYLTRLETMAKATPNDVKTAANKWLRANHYTMTVKPFEKLTAQKSTLDRKILPALAVPIRAAESVAIKNGNGNGIGNGRPTR